MIYLINMGMDKELSFTIMESVRKGKGLKPEWEEAMLKADVPDWYIWSCGESHIVKYFIHSLIMQHFLVFELPGSLMN